MAIDHSIYFQQETPDFLGSIQKGLSMRDMMDQRKIRQDEQARATGIREAQKAGIVTNPDGTVTQDRGLTASALIKGGYGDEVLKMQDQWKAKDVEDQKLKREQMMLKIDDTSRLAGAALQNPNAWPEIRAQAIAQGLATEQELPTAYNQNLLQQFQYRALSAKDQLAQKMEQEKLQSAAADRAETRAGRLQEKATQLNEKNQALATPFGQANTVDDAKQIKEGFLAKKAFDNKLDQMIALREKHKGGALLNREDVARGKQLSKDLLLEYKNMAKLGVLSKSDEDIINAIIPEDPLEYNSPVAWAQGQDPTLSRLKSFKKDSDLNFQDTVSTRTRAGILTAANSKQGVPQSLSRPSGSSNQVTSYKTSDIEWAD